MPTARQRLLELELVEPSLCFAQAPEAADRFGGGRRLNRCPESTSGAGEAIGYHAGLPSRRNRPSP